MEKQEEYQLFLNHIDSITDRRPSITTTYLGVNTIIIGAITIILANSNFTYWAQQIATIGLLIIGIIVCNLWRRLIYQYNKLLGWWYVELRNIELNIPGCSRLVLKEYQELYSNGEKANSLSMSKHEISLTWLLTILYFTFGLVTLYLFVFQPN